MWYIYVILYGAYNINKELVFYSLQSDVNIKWLKTISSQQNILCVFVAILCLFAVSLKSFPSSFVSGHFVFVVILFTVILLSLVFVFVSLTCLVFDMTFPTKIMKFRQILGFGRHGGLASPLLCVGWWIDWNTETYGGVMSVHTYLCRLPIFKRFKLFSVEKSRDCPGNR